MHRFRRRRAVLVAAATALLPMSIPGVAPVAGETPPPPPTASAQLIDVDGAVRGTVRFTGSAHGVHVDAAVEGLAPGWHGFHVHGVGDCTVGDTSNPFLASGGHLASAAEAHGSHDHHGDLPLLWADNAGVATASFHTDNFTFAQLFDGDGSAVIVHAGPDNYANIPARYGGPDSTTRKTGDAGSRVRCGVVSGDTITRAGGYRMLGSDGGIFALGNASFHGAGTGDDAFLGVASTPSGKGYWLSTIFGEVQARGDAAHHGDASALDLNAPVVGLAAAPGQVTAVLRDVNGAALGSVRFSPDGDALRVDAYAEGLTPGWHGFHVHGTGNCTVGDPANPFLASGGHLASDAEAHGSHDHHGDLPVLYANESGVARTSFRTDNLTLAQMLDSDGSAVIVHGGPDNYANIPSRYGGPDSITLKTGDAGSRVRCGVVTTTGSGYWLAGSDGGVFGYGTAGFHGSAGNLPLNEPVVGIAATPSGGGYWLVALDGGVFSYGDAGFHGSAGDIRLNEPVVGMASTPSGRGYWLVAADGGVFAFGDAGYFGSAGDIKLAEPVAAMVPAPDGLGYWLIAADGGVFSFGSARFEGSVALLRLNAPVVAAAG